MKATLVPPTGARWLRKEVDRLFDRVWDEDEFASTGDWAPRLDLTDTPEFLTARIEIPGIDPADIHLTLDHDRLVVRGEKREEKDLKSERFLRTERTYGTFVRSVKLPVQVDTTKVNATFRNGLLVIVMPKAADVKGTTIPIKTT